MRVLYVLAFLLSSNCCLAQSQTKDPFIGLSKKEVVAKWGEPTTTRKDGKGGEILTYIRERQEISVSGKTGLIRKDSYIFFMDPSEKVTAWKIGEKPKPKRESDGMF